MELNEEQKLLLNHIEEASRTIAASLAEMELDEVIVRDPSIGFERESRLKILIERKYLELYEGFKALFFDFSQVEVFLKPYFDQLSVHQKEAIIGDINKMGQMTERFLNWPKDQVFTFQRVAGISNETMKWFYSVALDYVHQGDIEKGTILFRYLTFLNPLISEFWTSLGYCQMFKGETDEAINSFLTAIQIDPKALQAHIFLSQSYLRLNRTDEAKAAIKEFEKVLSEHPERELFLPYLIDLKGRL